MASTPADRTHRDTSTDIPSDRPPILTLRIDLVSDTEVWRVVEIDPTLTVETAVQVFQAAMGWHNIHLHEITRLAPRTRRRLRPGRASTEGPADSAVVLGDEWAVPVGDLLRGTGDRFRYIYDLTRRHEHLVEVICETDPVPGGPRVRFVDGWGSTPPDTEPTGFGLTPRRFGPVRFDRDRVARDVADAAHLPHGRRAVAADEAEHLVWFLGWVDGGVDLTATGRLHARDVAHVLEARGWDTADAPVRGPAGPRTTEDRSYPVLTLDERARALGLVHVRQGRLEVTREGAELARRPERIAQMLVERFPRSVVTGVAPLGWAVRR